MGCDRNDPHKKKSLLRVRLPLAGCIGLTLSLRLSLASRLRPVRLGLGTIPIAPARSCLHIPARKSDAQTNQRPAANHQVVKGHVSASAGAT